MRLKLPSVFIVDDQDRNAPRHPQCRSHPNDREPRIARFGFPAGQSAGELHCDAIVRLVADEAGKGPGQWVGVVDRPSGMNRLSRKQHSPINQTSLRDRFAARAKKSNQAIFIEWRELPLGRKEPQPHRLTNDGSIRAPMPRGPMKFAWSVMTMILHRSYCGAEIIPDRVATDTCGVDPTLC